VISPTISSPTPGASSETHVINNGINDHGKIPCYIHTNSYNGYFPSEDINNVNCSLDLLLQHVLKGNGRLFLRSTITKVRVRVRVKVSSITVNRSRVSRVRLMV